MRNTASGLWNDDAGAILCAELILVLTLLVIGVIVGLSCLQAALVGELKDLGSAFRSVNQSYFHSSMSGCVTRCGGGRTAWVAGSSYVDQSPGCGHGDIGFGFRPAVYSGGGGFGVGGSTSVWQRSIELSPAAPCESGCPPDSNGPFIPAPCDSPSPERIR